MIKIDRTRIPPPLKFLKIAEDEANRAVEFYSDPNFLRYGKPFPHRAYRVPEVQEALGELFYHKCAFCESRLDDLEPSSFRPRDMATNYDGTVTKPGYWWLAWEWSNLYPICPQCLRSKADRFPVEGSRATFERLGSPVQLGDLTSHPMKIQAMIANDEAIYVVTRDSILLVLDLDAGRVRSESTVPLENPTLITVTPDGRDVAIASKDGQFVIVHLSQRYYPQNTSRFEIDQPLHAIGLLPDGLRVIVATDDNLTLFDTEKIGIMQTLKGPQKRMTSLSISLDGQYLVSSCEDSTIYLWSIKTLEYQRALRGHDWAVVGAKIADNKVVSLSQRGSIRVWDLETGENQFTIEGHGADYHCFDLSNDGRYAICGNDFGVRVVDLHTRKDRLEFGDFSNKVVFVSCAPNGKYFLTLSGERLEAWHLDPVGAERALLLDPCRDETVDIFIFAEDGQVAANLSRQASRSTRQTPTDEEFSDLARGQITIDTFGLNRLELVEARKAESEKLYKEVQDILRNEASPDFTKLNDPNLPFAAMRRQLISKYYQELGPSIPTSKTPAESNLFEQLIGQYAVTSETFDKAFRNLEKLSVQRTETPIKDLKERDFFKRSALISKIVIDNYRCIEHLELNFAGGSRKKASWKVLLGENGVGKSSVLEAVALTLMDQSRLETIPEIKQGQLLKRGARKGSIQVYFITENLPVELALSPSGPVPKPTDAGLHTYLLGFGSARWLPGEGSHEPERDAYVRVRNLFNPFVPLTNAIAWLKDLKGTRQIKKYQKVELVLTRLLQLEAGTRFPLRNDVIYVQLPEKSITESERLDEMSDGYQTVLAIAVTIMDMLGEQWNLEMEAAEGLVLLDEIGAHLHPRWKMKIVDSLRSAFPRMQFLATTHEPLCLRGLYDNEILLLRKVEGNVKAYPIIDSPDTLTTDQLLRSPLFGMLTTFDPEVDHDLERYAMILSKPEKTRTEDENTELEDIRNRLGSQGILAQMARKQVVHSVLEDTIPKPIEFDPETATPETVEILKGLATEIDLDLNF